MIPKRASTLRSAEGCGSGGKIVRKGFLRPWDWNGIKTQLSWTVLSEIHHRGYCRTIHMLSSTMTRARSPPMSPACTCAALVVSEAGQHWTSPNCLPALCTGHCLLTRHPAPGAGPVQCQAGPLELLRAHTSSCVYVPLLAAAGLLDFALLAARAKVLRGGAAVVI